MSRISEAIAGCKASIEKEDLRILIPLIEKVAPKVILEIGTWKGYSAMLWHNAFQPNTLITIEKQTREELEGIEMTTGKRFYLWNRDSHDPETLAEAKAILKDQEVDFLFIDGDHSYEGVKKDFEMYAPLVKKGGIIAFHDALYHADKTEEVDIFWNEIKEISEFTTLKPIEIKAGKNSTGIGVIYA